MARSTWIYPRRASSWTPATGQPVEVHKRATRAGIKEAYSMVEEMMLLANELVARFLTEKDIPRHLPRAR